MAIHTKTPVLRVRTATTTLSGGSEATGAPTRNSLLPLPRRARSGDQRIVQSIQDAVSGRRTQSTADHPGWSAGGHPAEGSAPKEGLLAASQAASGEVASALTDR